MNDDHRVGRNLPSRAGSVNYASRLRRDRGRAAAVALATARARTGQEETQIPRSRRICRSRRFLSPCGRGRGPPRSGGKVRGPSDATCCLPSPLTLPLRSQWVPPSPARGEGMRSRLGLFPHRARDARRASLRAPAARVKVAPVLVGRSQVVRQRILIPPFPGSNPGAPANITSDHAFYGTATGSDRSAVERDGKLLYSIVRPKDRRL